MTWKDRINEAALDRGVDLGDWGWMTIRDLMSEASPLPLSELSQEQFEQRLDAALSTF